MAATTLDLADLSGEPRWIDRWSVDGDVVSARLTGGSVRLVTSTHPTPVPAEIAEPYGPEQEATALAANREAAATLPLDQVLPQSRRTPTDGTTEAAAAVGCDHVSAAPAAAGGGLLLVTTLVPSRGLAPTDAVGVVADGDLVYAAADRIVVATSRWGTGGFGRGVAGPTEPVTTTLHSFDTSAAESTRYVASGEIPGFLLGRWALSYDLGYLRAVTTEQPLPASPATPVASDRGISVPPPTVSTMTVLREEGSALVPTGSVSGLGEGEQVQSVRFFGDLATVVTFRQTDPLYVLDLSDPTAPAVTGELKVTGFSTYLHPLGGDLLLGLGREADEQGLVTGTQASVFDLSDRARPVQVSRLQLGQGESPALTESRAFTYDPVSRQVLLLNQRYDPGAPPDSLRAVHVDDDGQLVETASLGVALPDAYRSRVLVDGDRVYTVTPTTVQVSTLDLLPTGSLSLA